MPEERRISFGEFSQRKGLGKRMKHAFSAHVMSVRGRLDFRTAGDWEGLYRLFLAADRRR